jgi:hypothetical protein
MTPNVAIIHIDNPHWRGLHLWLPLFLLWIPVLLLSPLILLVLLAVCIVGRVSFWQAISTFWRIVGGLPGTDIHVCTDGNTVRVRIL